MDIYDVIRFLNPERAENIIDMIEDQPVENQGVLKEHLAETLGKGVRSLSLSTYGNQESVDELLSLDDRDNELLASFASHL